ncbi:MAG: phytanoyl-CoA dioxygenase family protein [Sulfurovum sp.]|uniref:phytanoyl-CoA dioxygenase family protein n=1 Tax=Sulfurovum sp. TaxID=1969726 RepID=UPI002867C0F0|nr:phytanoyl-CoA dioxygenase family protein [Sulfurovum sp.]MCO4844697.1 phytanoyl-CoA dioxygenase family protein [Sulfurovum sp.]
MQLTATQLAQFNNDGFIVLRSFVAAERCDAILEVAKEHLEQLIEPIETELGYDSRSKAYRTEVTDYSSKAEEEHIIVRRLRQVYERNPLFKAWMEEMKIRPILQQVLDDEVVLTTAHHNSIMTKMPQISSSTGWHQDRRYWSYSDDNLVSVWLALDDETDRNGVLEFIPGSHKMQFKAEQFDEKEYFSTTYLPNKKIIATKISTDLKKGDVVIFHSLLLHRANKNSTNKPKISFVYTVKGEQTNAIEGTRSSEYPEIKLEKI